MTVRTEDPGSEHVRTLVADHAPDRSALWQLDRSHYRPTVFIVADGMREVAALVTARPHTAAHKIADVIVAEPDTHDSVAVGELLRQVLSAIVQAHPDHAVTRIEARPHLAELLREQREIVDDAGFIRSRRPLPSIPSTTEPIEGWLRWADGRSPGADIDAGLPAYIGQTTEFTCGAVSLVTALHQGDGRVLREPADRATNQFDELRWWRKATNMPAVDPVSLAVADTEAAGGVSPRVYLTQSPVLLEGFTGPDRDYRAFLQENSLAQARADGIEIIDEWPGVQALAEQVVAGHRVQLLIDEIPMHDDPTPHWVMAFGVTTTASGMRAVVVQDPWVDADHGETWVDADQLPIALDDLDLMARYGDPGYHAAIVLPPS
ncbi:hypothetical protein GCM10027169_09390 [Gordonia jinhuaensis]|uniref:Peptidase_C39 like family protein n=1 Tax=Gordonia jinhuaensis TaxID=1517702 RepID=A0A916TFN2_9ACTN|nr:peptidase C39 family protein [Gordonia jinhuaensis]GGB43023.1 hypothetical protein GCM10011489_33150 [Gordonia jinhuaensis]